MTRSLIAALAIFATACASGTAIMRLDGSCEVRGIAIGDAQIAAFRPGGEETRAHATDAQGKGESTTRAAHELCASIGGGEGSPGWYGFLGAIIGAGAAALAANREELCEIGWLTCDPAPEVAQH